MKLHYGNKFFSVLNKFKLQFIALLILVLGIGEPMFFLLIFPFGGFACSHFLFRPRGERKRIIEGEDLKNPTWRSNTPDPYYESAEYKKFSKQRKKKYEEMRDNKEIGSVEGSTTGTQFGTKGGRYQERISKKTGKTYRQYY